MANGFIYDKIVRQGEVTVSPAENYQVGYEPSKIKNIWIDYVYRSAAGTKNANIDIEAKDSVEVTATGCVLYGLNLTSSYTTLKLQRYTTVWVDVCTLYYDADNGRALGWFSQVSASKYRIVMADSTVSSYVQLGIIILGDFIEISRGYEYGATSDLDDSSAHRYSKDGHLNVAVGREIELQAVTYEVMAADEAKLETIYKAVRKRYPLVFIEDSAQLTETMKYIIFQARFGRRIPGYLFKTITLSWMRLD